MKPADARAARKAKTDRRTFDADARATERESSPVKLGGVTFTRRRKDWMVTRGMRALMRNQEGRIALANRLRARIGELEAQQIEAAVEDRTDDETALESQIEGFIKQADAATEEAELVTYRLLVMLLVPPAAPTADGAEDPVADCRLGFGPEAAGFDDLMDADEDAVLTAVEFLKPALDTEDAVALAQELTGSVEPDPAEDPSSATG